MTISEHSQLTLFEAEALETSRSSAEAFPVRTCRSLESELASRVRDLVFGRSSPGSFAKYDPSSSSWKTSEACFLPEWDEYSETWPRSGTIAGGIAFQLQPLVPPISANGSGSSDTNDRWPTPQASDNRQRGTQKATARRLEMGKQIGLEAAVKFFPTVTRHTAKENGYPAEYTRRTVNLGAIFVDREQNTGTLNPDWVEWMMGYPVGWTRLTGWSSRKASRALRKGSKTAPKG